MAEMQVEGLDANRYDSSLSYEERSRIGMEEREKLQENAKVSVYFLSITCLSPVPSF